MDKNNTKWCNQVIRSARGQFLYAGMEGLITEWQGSGWVGGFWVSFGSLGLGFSMLVYLYLGPEVFRFCYEFLHGSFISNEALVLKIRRKRETRIFLVFHRHSHVESSAWFPLNYGSKDTLFKTSNIDSSQIYDFCHDFSTSNLHLKQYSPWWHMQETH